MNDEQYRNMVVDHDKHIDKLTTSVEVLAGSMTETNNKLNTVIEVMTQQNVLIERVNHIDKDTKEAFNRVYADIREVKEQQSGKGCVASNSVAAEMHGVRKDISIHAGTLANVEDEVDGMISAATLKWAAVIIVGYMITFGTFVTKELHRLDKLTIEKIHIQRGINKHQAVINKELKSMCKEIGMDVKGSRQ